MQHLNDVVLWLTATDADILLQAISELKTKPNTPAVVKKTLENISGAIDWQLYGN